MNEQLHPGVGRQVRADDDPPRPAVAPRAAVLSPRSWNSAAAEFVGQGLEAVEKLRVQRGRWFVYPRWPRHSSASGAGDHDLMEVDERTEIVPGEAVAAIESRQLDYERTAYDGGTRSLGEPA